MKPLSSLLITTGIACVLLSCTKDVQDVPSNTATYSILDTLQFLTKETESPEQNPISVNIDANIGGYLEALPANYNRYRLFKRYPLIIFEHGVGELGNGTTDLHNVSRNGIPHMIENKTFPASFTVNGYNYSFIVLSPQFKKQPDPAQLNDMLDYAIKKYSIDTTRVYVVGISMGGGTAWHYSGLFRNRVAAAVPMCGASGLNETQCQTIAQTALPVWAFHNDGDPVVPVATTNNWITHINKYKPVIAPLKTIFRVAAHDCWTQASDPNYKELIHGKSVNIYEWMLSYHK